MSYLSGLGFAILLIRFLLFRSKSRRLKSDRERFTNSLQTSDKLEKIVFSYLLDSFLFMPKCKSLLSLFAQSLFSKEKIESAIC